MRREQRVVKSPAPLMHSELLHWPAIYTNYSFLSRKSRLTAYVRRSNITLEPS